MLQRKKNDVEDPNIYGTSARKTELAPTILYTGSLKYTDNYAPVP